MAEGVTVANAFVQVMPSMEGAQANITSALSGAVESAADVAGEKGGQGIGAAILGAFSGLGGKFAAIGGEVGTALEGGISGVLAAASPAAIAGAVAAAGVAVTAALIDVGGEFDDMTDSIIIGTGASGDALDGLVDVATNIGTSVPTSFGNAGDIVQELSTRMGLTGDTLQEVGTKMASLQNIAGNFNMDQMTGAFNLWGVSGEEAGQKMDYLWGVSQSTGASIDDLTGVLSKSGPAMQALGFSFEDTADMAGMLDKAGLNSSAVMGSMSKALANVAKDGGDVQQTFRDSVGAIQGYIDAGDEASAVNAAADIFGTRNAPQFVAALKSGAINMDALGQATLGASGDIEATEDATMDFPEILDLVKNRFEAAIEPLASGAFSAATSAAQGLSDAFDWLGQALKPVADVLGKQFSGAAKELGPILKPISKALSELGKQAVPLLGDTFKALAKAIDFVGTVLGAVWQIIKPFAVFLGNVLVAHINAVTTTFRNMRPVVNAIGNIYQTAANTIRGAWSGMSGFFSGVVSAIRSVFAPIGNVIGGVFRTAASIASGAMNGIRGVVSGVVGAIRGIVGGISGAFSAAFNTARAVATAPLNAIKNTARDVVNSIKNFFSGLHIKLPSLHFPHINLPHFSVSGGKAPWGIGGKGSLPSFSVKWYAKAMDEPMALDGATIFGAMGSRLLGGGETGREYVMGERALVGIVRDAIGSMGTTVNVTVNPSQGMDERELAEMVAYRIQQIVERTEAVWA